MTDNPAMSLRQIIAASAIPAVILGILLIPYWKWALPKAAETYGWETIPGLQALILSAAIAALLVFIVTASLLWYATHRKPA